jgi:hypothetical protein
MSIIAYRQAIIDRLRGSFPQLNDVEPHPGKFTLEDFEQLLHRSPRPMSRCSERPHTTSSQPGEVLFDIHVCVFLAARCARRQGRRRWQFAEAIAALALRRGRRCGNGR